MRFAVILRRYSSMSVLFAPSKVTAELLPSAFGVHTKNVSSPLRSGEITNAAIPVFGKAETPPALWRRGVQPGSKNGSRFCSCHSPSMREARGETRSRRWNGRHFPFGRLGEKPGLTRKDDACILLFLSGEKTEGKAHF